MALAVVVLVGNGRIGRSGSTKSRLRTVVSRGRGVVTRLIEVMAAETRAQVVEIRVRNKSTGKIGKIRYVSKNKNKKKDKKYGNRVW